MSAQDFRNNRARAASDSRGAADEARFSSRRAHAGALPSAIFRSLGGRGFARLNDGLVPVHRLRWAAAVTSSATAYAPEAPTPARNRQEWANSSRHGHGLTESGAPDSGSFQLLWRSLLRFAAVRSATAPQASSHAQLSARTPGSVRGPASQLSGLAALHTIRRVHDAALIAARRSTERRGPATVRTEIRSIERAQLPARLRSTAGELSRIDFRKLAPTAALDARGGAAVRTSALAQPFAYRSVARSHDSAGVISTLRGAMPFGRPAEARRPAWNSERPAFTSAFAIPRAALKLRNLHSRESVVRAVSRHFGSAPSAADLESAPASRPDRRAHASADPALVIHYAPSLNFGAEFAGERLEQAVSDALSSQVPDLLRQMRAEIAKRRRTSFT